jgi:hypothetical protein
MQPVDNVLGSGDVSGAPAEDNCESFATWCKIGVPVSDQARSALAHATGVGAGGTVAAAVAGTVSTASVAAAGSGPAMMAGLAGVGKLVGGGAAAGLPMIGAVPGVIAAGAHLCRPRRPLGPFPLAHRAIGAGGRLSGYRGSPAPLPRSGARSPAAHARSTGPSRGRRSVARRSRTGIGSSSRWL